MYENDKIKAPVEKDDNSVWSDLASHLESVPTLANLPVREGVLPHIELSNAAASGQVPADKSGSSLRSLLEMSEHANPKHAPSEKTSDANSDPVVSALRKILFPNSDAPAPNTRRGDASDIAPPLEKMKPESLEKTAKEIAAVLSRDTRAVLDNETIKQAFSKAALAGLEDELVKKINEELEATAKADPEKSRYPQINYRSEGENRKLEVWSASKSHVIDGASCFPYLKFDFKVPTPQKSLSEMMNSKHQSQDNSGPTPEEKRYR